MSSLVIALVFAGLYAWSRRRDPRLLRNGLFFVAALWFAVWGVLTEIATVSPTFGVAVILVIALTPLTVVVLAVFAIVNGITVIRAEGFALATSLSLLAGLGLLVLPLVMVLLVLTTNPWAIAVAALIFLVASYLGVVFIGFGVYSLVYGRTAQQTRPAVLVILGSRIIDGQVPPLLRSRLDTALALYRRDRLTGPAPLLIPSGGQGEDESRSEGEAMAEYLIAQGADPADVAPETRAVNTRQNLLLSKEIQVAAGRPGPVLAVTSNYHVLRAAILAREVGSDAQVIGAPTASYYVPSAFLREFVAVLVQQRRYHLLIVLPFLAITGIAVVTLNLVS